MDAISLIAEERIRMASEEGVFDDLEGRGRPLSLDSEDFVPEALRMAYRILKNGGFVPPEIAERKEAECLLDLLEHDAPERTKLEAMRRLEALVFSIRRHAGPSAVSEFGDYYDRIVRRLERCAKRASEEAL